jgi:hypothetical protein
VHTQLYGATVGQSKDLLLAAHAEIDAEILSRHPGDHRARNAAALLPLRMKIFYGLDENREQPQHTLRANTVRAARDILLASLKRIEADQYRSYPGDPDAQDAVLEEPLRVSIHYSLQDLDRVGPLDVDDCLFLPYAGIPRGLRPSANVHRTTATRAVGTRRGRARRRGVARLLLGP